MCLRLFAIPAEDEITILAWEVWYMQLFITLGHLEGLEDTVVLKIVS
jgi:hypothetical protein